MDEQSTQAVRDLAGRTVETVGEVRQLLGLLSYHRRHVQDFAIIAKPLTDILLDHKPLTKVTSSGETKKVVPSNTKIEWKVEHKEALQQLITAVTTPPILAYPNFDKEFFLHCDASGKGLGAILYQTDDDGADRVIAYASRSLKASEKNYHSSKLEFLSMYWAITTKFRPYLQYADGFKVYTDNNPLLYVMQGTKPNVTLQRWISELSEFKFSIHYRPGVINRDADCLSRLPLSIGEYKEQCHDKVTLNTFQQLVAHISVAGGRGLERNFPSPPDTVYVAALQTSDSSLQINIQADQQLDPYISPVLQLLEGKGDANALQPGSHASLLWRERKQLRLSTEDGILRRKGRSGYCIVLPLKHRDLIYKSLHNDLGHLGSERVLRLAKDRVYWPKMQADIEEYTQQRCPCLRQKRVRQQSVAPLVSIHSSHPMELVAIDFLHLDKSSGGFEYILLIVDHFTRYGQAYPTKNKYALTAAKHLFNDFILKFGLPNRVISDQGKEFENKLIHELSNFCGIIKSRTTPYHPQTNGTVERLNSTLLHMLRTLAESDKPRWHEHLGKLMSAYNATPHSTTGYSPHFLLFGREPTLPLDLLLKSHPRPDVNLGKQYSKFVDEWEERMSEAYRIAKEHCDQVKTSSEVAWRKRKIASRLLVGDKVLVRNKREQGGPGKLRSFWEEDIFVVKDCKGDGVVYEVENTALPSDKRVLHRNLLLPCELLEDTPVAPVSLPHRIPKRATRSSASAKPSPSVHQSSDSESDLDLEVIPAPPLILPDQGIPLTDTRWCAPPPVEAPDFWTTPESTAPSGSVSPEINPSLPLPEESPTNPIGDILLESDSSSAPIQCSPIPPTPSPCPMDAPVDESRCELRSRGKRLTWNPNMGESNVVVPHCPDALSALTSPEASVTSETSPSRLDGVAMGEARRSGRERGPPLVLTYSELGGVPANIPLVDNTDEIDNIC